MAAKTRIKIYTPKNEFIASCKYFEDASILSLAGGPGMTVRMGHAKRDTIWTEPDHDNDADRDSATEYQSGPCDCDHPTEPRLARRSHGHEPDQDVGLAHVSKVDSEST